MYRCHGLNESYLVSPSERAKSFPLSYDLLHSSPLYVGGVESLQVPPPLRRRLVRKLQRKENDNGREGQANIQAGRSDVVEAHPPAAIPVLDEFVENESGGAPGQVVEWRGGRQVRDPVENDGRREVAELGLRPSSGGQVEYDGSNEPHNPEVEEAGVDMARAEDASRTNEAPDDACVEENTGLGAGEMIGLLGGAYVLNGAQGPVHDADLYNARPDGGNGLGHKHSTRRDFHVVT